MIHAMGNMNTDPALRMLEDVVRNQGKQLDLLEKTIREQEKANEDMGGVIDHVLNTIDDVLIPKLSAHDRKFEEHEETVKSHQSFIDQQRGAWQLIVRIGVVVAAVCSVATLILKLKGM